MDERLRFVARLLDGEKMAPLCTGFGISRKTGCTIYHRDKGCGIEGTTDRSRRLQRLFGPPVVIPRDASRTDRSVAEIRKRRRTPSPPR